MDPLQALPSDFTNRLSRLIPASDLLRVQEGFTQKRVTTLRANTLKIDPATLQKQCAEQGVTLTPVNWYGPAFIVENTPLRTITELPECKEGKLYIQSLSSMIPPLVLDPKPGEKVLDIAAAPGSKTTQMATLMHNTGELLANDSSQTRSYRLQGNLRIQGATMVRTTKLDGRSIWTKYPEYFDKTLVDVPCSMEGRFNTNDPKSFEDWSLKKVRDLSALQRFLLRSAVSATKPGGTIVYSTCTLSPEENEEVINWILEKDKGILEVESISIPGLTTAPAITAWGDKTYNAAVTHTARIYPSVTMEGFYIAKLIKLKSSIPKVLLQGY
jgi:16S rRNA (cytosine1407-C5)-methyltransferase